MILHSDEQALEHPIVGGSEAGEVRAVRWRSEAGVPPPKRVVVADDRMTADAAYRLALMYHNGQGVSKDTTQALPWYQKAAEKGIAEAQYNLAVIYATVPFIAAALGWLVMRERPTTGAVTSSSLRSWGPHGRVRA